MSVPMISHVSLSEGLSAPVPSGNADIIDGFSLVYMQVSVRICALIKCVMRENIRLSCTTIFFPHCHI